MEAVTATTIKLNPATAEGRVCNCCGKNKTWSEFDRKKGGLNDKDSRCKSCIKKLRNDKKRKIKQQSSKACKFDFTVTGESEAETVATFSKIVATSLMQLLERGLLK